MSRSTCSRGRPQWRTYRSIRMSRCFRISRAWMSRSDAWPRMPGLQGWWSTIRAWGRAYRLPGAPPARGLGQGREGREAREGARRVAVGRLAQGAGLRPRVRLPRHGRRPGSGAQLAAQLGVELAGGRVEGAGEGHEPVGGDVLAPALDLREMGDGDAGDAGDIGQRPLAGLAPPPENGPEGGV